MSSKSLLTYFSPSIPFFFLQFMCWRTWAILSCRVSHSLDVPHAHSRHGLPCSSVLHQRRFALWKGRMVNVTISPAHPWCFPRNLVNGAGDVESSMAVVVPASSAWSTELPGSLASLMELPPSQGQGTSNTAVVSWLHSKLWLTGFSEVVGEAASLSPQKNAAERPWNGACLPAWNSIAADKAIYACC